MSNKPTRRSFFATAGATLAAPLAATAAFAGERDAAGYLAGRRSALEDVDAIHALLAAVLAAPARLGLDAGTHIAADRNDAITIAADGTATARVPCTVETATPIESCGTLVEMARLQGDGVVRRSERRVLASTFVKRNGTWHIEHMELTA
jgi:hypothetical protein